MIVSNERERRQQWLNSLKVGDEVAVDDGRITKTYLISTITRITPTRRFTIEGKSAVFGNDGKEMGERYEPARMHPVTEGIRDKVARNAAIKFIESTHFKNLTTQQLLDVLKVIQQNE